MNIRKRLVAWHAIILAGFLLIFTIGLFMALNFHLYAEVDGSLESWAAHSIESINYDDTFIVGNVHLNSNHASPHFNLLDSFGLVLSQNEKIETEHNFLSKQSLSKLQRFLKPKSRNSRDNYATIILNSQPYRIYYKMIPDKKILVLGRSLMHVKETLSGLIITLTFAWIIAVFACSIISWIFVGKTLCPVKTMTNDALDIAASGELGERIKSFSDNDEFGELSRALNRMLLSLEMSYTAQKKFLADASHELRNPLTSIRANLEFMKRATGAPGNERLAALDDTIAETNRISKLVNELLMLARAEASVSFIFERTDLSQIVNEVLLSYQTRQEVLRKKFTYKISRPVFVKGDPEKLHQVMVILLDNAVKFSPDDSEIKINVVGQDDLARLEITDNGPGIPANEIELVFNRFYRATNVRNKTTGSGLGLPIVKTILSYHGGKIELKNLEPTGLSVIASLPVIT